MKFSTRKDADVPADQLFAAVTDFPRMERMLMRRGVAVARIDPAQEPGNSMAWRIAFDWRAKRREVRLDVARFDRPEQVGITGMSDPFEMVINMTIVALSRTRSRLIFETDLRPRNMKSRLLLQTARLGKAQLDRRFARRVGEFIDELMLAA
ncbi:MAG: SRPBCC family protein [Paracoccus sp. (in: a-proteobacteria)]|uniref:SRPBCC family protein n=1 Tax=Paracoccus sp. TaxID=267 RepID=UPI0026DFEC58|nr:SRPBCC family protein [Paracoccus sp. (in: a-proteobacteria)]MDO5612102.1 SRPBCC family protein [Paracoccus sp. (in: a-proteobacteria)]